MRKTLIVSFLLGLTTAYAQDIRTGDALVHAMHDRYANTWYHTLTFTQKSTTYKEDGTSSAETWYEAAQLPGKLRIDIGKPEDGNGYVLVDGNVTVVKENKIAMSRHSVNMLLVLGFDVYTQDVATTEKVIQGEGYDLGKLREDTWEGKPVYVVGADKGDLKAKQFWVTKDTLLFVREIEPARQYPSKVDDIRFTDYRPLEKAWVAARVEVHADGKLVFSEDYTDIKANVTLPAGTYDPAQFATSHWEK